MYIECLLEDNDNQLSKQRSGSKGLHAQCATGGHGRINV